MPADSEAPPTYNSVFGELKQQKSQSSGLADYTRNASGVVKSKIGGVCSLIIFILCLTVCSLGLPIAEIVIGALHQQECDAQRLLPIYLIVLGAFSLGTGCGTATNKASKKRDEEEDSSTLAKVCGCCSSLIGVFLFCWFICGNVWVFKMKECDMETFNVNSTSSCFTTDATYKGTGFYCHKLLYDFVFWETVARWAIVGSIGVLACLCWCVMCCAYCCSS